MASSTHEHEGCLILVVDDSQAMRLLLRRAMEHDGYQVVEAQDGRAAVDLFRSAQPDIVLMDAEMPLMDGFEACVQLRATAIDPQPPILMITGLDDNESVNRAFECGASDFVTKPIHWAVLRQRMRQLVRTRGAEKQLRKSEEQFRRVFEGVPVGMALTEQDGTLLQINDALSAMLGYTPADLVSQTIAALTHPEDQRRDGARMAEVSNGALPCCTLDQRFVKQSGEILWADVRTTAIRDHTRSVAYYLTMIEDITDRKRAELLEGERRHVAYELHDGVAQVAASTHQHLQAYIHRYAPRRPDARRELEHIVGLGQRLVRETRRIIAGLRPSALDDFGLVRAIAMHVESLRAEGWNITFNETLDGARLPQGYEIALYRIMQEALTNVRKHANTTTVCLSLEQDGDWVRLEVTDRGRGFDDSRQPVAVGPGERVGLRGMVDRMALLGGRLTLQTAIGAGTKVVAEVPALHIGKAGNQR